jgi:hypothetical protein
MLPCYKGHKSSSEGIQRDLKHQKHNHIPRNFLKGLEEELWKYNPIREWDKYEIGQSTTTMKTTNKKIKKCANKCKTKISKLMCL